MKTVEYKNGWGKVSTITYYASPNIVGEGHWYTEVSQEVLEMLLERAGFYRVQ